MNIKHGLFASVAAFDNPPYQRGGYNDGGYVPTEDDAAKMAATRNGTASHNDDAFLQRSPDIQSMVEYWDLTDALIDGITAVRDMGEVYLPRFPDEDSRDYNYRKRSTKMTNIYRDIVEGLASKPFEKEVTIAQDDDNTPPDELTEFIEDVDGSGNNLTAFASSTFYNAINSAIDWIFVDMPKLDATVRTRADAKAAGVRPYWSHVLARNVYEVQSEVINGSENLIYIRILEPGAPDRMRVFERLGNVVTWELFVKGNAWRDLPDNKRTQFVSEDTGTLTIDTIPLTPVWTGRRNGRTHRYSPAMRDAADLQLEMYEEESGLKFAKKLTAYPMLAGNGVNPPKDADGKLQKLAVGPARVLYAPPDGEGRAGSWAYVEPNASSLKFLSDDIDKTEQKLRELGRQPLTAQSGITTIQAGVAAGKAKSAVSAWALNLKNGLENAFVITCKFMKIAPETYDPTISVYTDFDQWTDGKDLDTLDADRDRGDISRQTLWEEKQRRNVYSDEFTAEREEKRLLDEIPTLGAADVDPNDPGGTPAVAGTGGVKPAVNPAALGLKPNDREPQGQDAHPSVQAP